MYHAYDRKSNIFTGREGLLIEYKFTPDGWIEFVKEKHAQNVVPAKRIADDFGGSRLSMNWQWSVFQQPQVTLSNGALYLPASNTASGTFLGQPTLAANYSATVKLLAQKTNAASGISAIGDEKNIITAFYRNGTVRLVQVKDGKETELANKTVAKSGKLYLRLRVRNAKEMRFSYSKNGKAFIPLTMNGVDGGFLPPWDRALRVGIVAKGDKGTNGVFDSFEMVNK